MLKLDPFVFCGNNVPGNDIIAAMDMARRCGFKRIELPAIDGVSEQVAVSAVSPEYVARIRRELEKRDLICYAVSGHCDMTQPVPFEGLLKKIEFAGELGAKYLNTRCGPKERYGVFTENIRRAAEAADRYGLIINLESYGDIVSCAAESGPVFEELGLPNVRYNYDGGNTFRFQQDIDLVSDLEHASCKVEYLHVKDAAVRDGRIHQVAIGSGRLPYAGMFRVLEKRQGSVAGGLEIPQSFCVRCTDLVMEPLAPTEEQVFRAVTESVEYVRTIADVEF